MSDLAGRTAIITGGATGIGAAIATAFAQAGAKVAVFDTDTAQAADLVARIGAQINARAYPVDVGDLAMVQDAVQQVTDDLGAPAILVNNAAVRTARAPITELDPKDWDLALRVNLTGAFNLCRTVLPLMITAGHGVIINVASQLGSVAAPGAAAYCATKGALLQLTRALALDHGAQNIRVNSLSPGAVLTGRLETVFGSRTAAEDALVPLHPIGRLGLPDDIAEAAVFLASDKARFMTGADLVVDGGYLAR